MNVYAIIVHGIRTYVISAHVMNVYFINVYYIRSYVINMYATRFLFPLKHFAFEKLRFKRPKLFFMTQRLRDSVDQKIEKEMASIDFLKFQKEKKYMLFVLEKTN